MTLSTWSASLVLAAALAGCTTPRSAIASAAEGAGRAEAAPAIRRTRLGRAGTLTLARSGDGVHLSLEDGADGIASVFLYDGERVFVLHASAALGTAVFARAADGGWRRLQDFTFEARDPDDLAAREAFWKKHGWLANVTPPGSGARPGGDRTFAIDVKRFQVGAPLRVAAGYLHLGSGAPAVDPWPTGLQDGVASVALHEGHTEPSPVFAPERWATLAAE